MFRIAKANQAIRTQSHRIGQLQSGSPCFRGFTSNEFRNIEDDGYVNTKKSSFGKLISKFAKLQDAPRKPGSLILIRHGESEWNHKKLFTGWVDVDLSERGCREIEHAARLLLERGYRIDIAYTSMLKRAIRSSWIILNELNQIYRPMIKSWRLNERMYGALEGHSKPGLAKMYGEQQVQRWRSGLNDRPPEMTKDHLYYHGNEAKYAHMNLNELPLTESLQDTIDRTIPLWNSQILPDLQAGRNVLICAHRNSIRGIIKHIDNLSTEEIQKVGIPNGIPLVYKFDHNMVPLQNKEAAAPLSGIWLEKQGQLRAALEKEKELAESISGYTGTLNSAPSTNPTDSHATSVNNISQTLSLARTGINTIANNNNARLLKSLAKLKEQRLLYEDAPLSGHKIDNHNEGAHTQPLTARGASTVDGGVYLSSNYTYNDLAESDPGGGDILSKAELYVDDKLVTSSTTIAASAAPAGDSASGAVSASTASPATPASAATENGTAAKTEAVAASESSGAVVTDESEDDILKRPLLVIIRHGKTAHNQLGLFTGWEDAPLTDAGREEALHAGKLLKLHGAKIDVVYTSWLSRAIETAWIVMNELDVLWLPIVKTWRLNERMYGALTGLSKKMIQQIYGDAQFKKWRRGFNEPPPPISSFSNAYPGNDKRYVQYVQDLDISYFETAIRSLAHGKLEVHYNFPKSESLKDCMERTVPYFSKVIGPDSITPGKNVMISSSENAIRGLLMHLCDIPEDKIHAVEIPTGLPMLYDFKTKRIRLLDDKQEHTIMKRYNFGHDPDLLFKRTIKPGQPTGVDNNDLSEVMIRSKGVVIKYDEENRIKLD